MRGEQTVKPIDLKKGHFGEEMNAREIIAADWRFKSGFKCQGEKYH